MDLTARSATELCSLLTKKEVSSEELTRAHLSRIDRLDGTLRAFTRVFRDEALVDARRADEERARGEVRSPLHGMPVSVKESIDIAGLASTMGVPSRTALIARADGGMIEALRAAGAVILGRTNVSQYLLFHESRNPLFGQTANPFSLAHTPGGSSGGEAAAIASGMSPLGIGTDIGGSIRVPAHFTGVCGLKPTLDRWTNKGSNTSLAGQEAVRGQIGPMARTTEDLALMMRALDPRRQSRIDPRVPPLPFDDPDEVDLRGLRVGVYVDDGLVKPSTSVARAIERAAEALRVRGCAVVAFTPPGAVEAIYSYFAALSSDGGETIARGLEGGPIDPVLVSLRRVARLRPPIRRALSRMAAMLGEEKLARLLEATRGKRVDEYWRITNEMRAYRFKVLTAMDDARIDLLVCPAHATPALPHGMSKDFPVAGSGSMLFNVLQFPAGVVPVTRVRTDELTRNALRGRLERHAAEVDRQSASLPVGAQVVGRPWREDVVLAAMKAIEDECAVDASYPRTPIEPNS